jgi:hypothetical protein
MAKPTKDTERGNIHTGILQVKIVLDKDNVVSLRNEHIRECYFIEDIFTSCMTGRISFLDDFGMYEYGPFTGNEVVSIVYGRSETREVVFHILRVEKILSSASTGSQVSPYVVMDIADTTYEFFTSYRYSRSYETSLKHTDVVKHIIRNQVGWNDNKQLSIIPSTSELTEPFITPYWTPKMSIDWLLARSYNKDDAGYLCYANTYNRHTINVKPLTHLLSKNNIMDQKSYKLEVSNGTDDPMELKNKILEWWVDGIDHTTTRPIRNSKYYGFDITEKKMRTHILNYDDGIKYTPVLGNYTLFENNYQGDGTRYTGINFSNGEEQDIQMRKHSINDFVKRYCSQQLMNVMVLGNEKRYAGHQIFIDWGSVDQKSKTKNKIFDGAYLVKSITHDFINESSPIGYIQRMVLIKNGFQTPSTRLLKKSKNINIAGGIKTPEFEEV